MTRRMMLVTRVVCDEEGDGNGYKSDGNEGDGRATVTRAMVTAMETAKATNQPTTGAANAGGGSGGDGDSDGSGDNGSGGGGQDSSGDSDVDDDDEDDNADDDDEQRRRRQ